MDDPMETIKPLIGALQFISLYPALGHQPIQHLGSRLHFEDS